MAKYTLVLSKGAAKYLDKLNDQLANPIINSISALADDPRPTGVKNLKADQVTVLESVIIGLFMKFLTLNY